jgi:rod shape-determining protein MreB
MLRGLDKRLQDELRIRVWVAEDPMSCVARGAGIILEDYDNLSRLLVGLERTSSRS